MVFRSLPKELKRTVKEIYCKLSNWNRASANVDLIISNLLDQKHATLYQHIHMLHTYISKPENRSNRKTYFRAILTETLRFGNNEGARK